VIVGFDLKENLRGISWNAKINQHINNDLPIITSPPTVRKIFFLTSSQKECWLTTALFRKGSTPLRRLEPCHVDVRSMHYADHVRSYQQYQSRQWHPMFCLCS